MRKGVVYFGRTKDIGPVKIGFSCNPSARVSTFGLDLLGVIYDATVLTERTIHRRFAAYRLSGEWFQASPEVLAFIREYSRPWDDRPLARNVSSFEKLRRRAKNLSREIEAVNEEILRLRRAVSRIRDGLDLCREHFSVCPYALQSTEVQEGILPILTETLKRSKPEEKDT